MWKNTMFLETNLDIINYPTLPLGRRNKEDLNITLETREHKINTLLNKKRKTDIGSI